MKDLSNIKIGDTVVASYENNGTHNKVDCCVLDIDGDTLVAEVILGDTFLKSGLVLKFAKTVFGNQYSNDNNGNIELLNHQYDSNSLKVAPEPYDKTKLVTGAVAVSVMSLAWYLNSIELLVGFLSFACGFLWTSRE